MNHRMARWRAGVALLSLVAALAAHAAPVDLSAVPQAATPLALPAHWQHGAFMEIFVRAYQDSNGDGVGDLKGLTSRLDYLKVLGIRGIWLMPIHKSADGDHGYATVDYRAVEPTYGTLADFDQLIHEAFKRGIGVVMDYVVNHSAAQHPLFVAARSDVTSPWRDWYVWSDVAPAGWDIWGKYPWYWTAAQPWTFKGEVKDLPLAPAGSRDFYFGTFGPHMPDFNLRNPAVVEYHLSSLRFWLNRGLAGYRLDAVPHMIENDAQHWNDQPESRALTKSLQDLIKSYPNRFVVCEATAEPQAYGDPAVCGGAFAFGYVNHFVDAARGKPESVARLAEYYRTASPAMATFLSNHDIFAGRRLWDQVEGDVARYKLAAAAYLLQPGTPFIYYGEEVGQAGALGLQGDLPLRSPMSWTPDARTGGFTGGTPFRPIAPNVATNNAQTQSRDPQSILNFYKAVLALRNTRASIARGSFEHSFADGLVLGFERVLGSERTLVLINYGTATAEARLAGLPARTHLHTLYPRWGAAAAADAAGAASVTLAPQSVRVFDVRR
jgi:alpha-amylase